MTQLPASGRFFTYFFVTMRLADASSDLLVRRIALLRDCVALAQQRTGVTVDSAAVLPAEMHLLCRLMPGENPGATLRAIRAGFARHADEGGLIWDREMTVVEVPAAALAARRRFLLSAPVRAGLVRDAGDWPYSSLHRRGAPQAESAPA